MAPFIRSLTPVLCHILYLQAEKMGADSPELLNLENLFKGELESSLLHYCSTWLDSVHFVSLATVGTS